jgi:hypothetical protein
MIVRVMGEGQLRIDKEDLGALNSLDDELEAAIGSGDEEEFRKRLGALLDRVRAVGTPVPSDSLEPSELILPPSDAAMDEVKSMLGDGGLIPD